MKTKKMYAYHVSPNKCVTYVGDAKIRDNLINVKLLRLPIDGKITLLDKKIHKGDKVTVQKLIKEAGL